MKVSNFVPRKSAFPGSLYEIKYADIDVTTGFFWWKKTTRHTIFKKGVYWRFLGTGKFTPGYKVEELEYSCTAAINNPNNYVR